MRVLRVDRNPDRAFDEIVNPAVLTWPQECPCGCTPVLLTLEVVWPVIAAAAAYARAHPEWPQGIGIRHRIVRVERRPGGGKRYVLGAAMAVNDRLVNSPSRAEAIWAEWSPTDRPEHLHHRFNRLSADNIALPRLVAIARGLHRLCVVEQGLEFEFMGSRVVDVGIQLGRFQLTNVDRFEYQLPDGSIVPSETDPDRHAWLCAWASSRAGIDAADFTNARGVTARLDLNSKCFRFNWHVVPTPYLPAGHDHAPILPPAFLDSPSIVAPDVRLPRPHKSRLSIFGSALPLDSKGLLDGAEVITMLHDLHEITPRPGIDPSPKEREHVFDHGENIVRCRSVSQLTSQLTCFLHETMRNRPDRGWPTTPQTCIVGEDIDV